MKAPATAYQLPTSDVVFDGLCEDAAEQCEAKAESLLPLTPEGMNEAAATLQGSMETRCIALQCNADAAEAEARQLAHDLEYIELGDPMRKLIAEHRQDDNNRVTAYVPDTSANDTVTMAREFLSFVTRRSLWGWTLAAVLAVVLTAAADIVAVSYIMQQRSLDAWGEFSGSLVQLIAISVATLFAYTVMGVLWQRGSRRSAGALYGLIFLGLCWFLLPTATQHARELWETLFDGNSLFGAQQQSTAPLWWLALGTGIEAWLFSMAGVLFILAKEWLLSYLRLWPEHGMATAIVAMADKSAALMQYAHYYRALGAQYQQNGHGQHRIVLALRLGIEKSYIPRVQSLYSGDLSVLGNVRSSLANKKRAQKRIESAEKCLESVQNLLRHVPQITAGLVLALHLAMAAPVFALSPATRTLIESAPTFQILVDFSTSSIAKDPLYVEGVFRVLDELLRHMPMATQIRVAAVGDAAVTPFSWVTRIQPRATPEGAPVEQIIRDLHALLLGMPSLIKKYEHQKSEFIGGLFDAARNINPRAASDNRIILLGDLLEVSAFANCESGKTCKLPAAPPFKLERTRITALGIGRGLPSEKAQALTMAWEKFLQKAGASSLDLRRN